MFIPFKTTISLLAYLTWPSPGQTTPFQHIHASPSPHIQLILECIPDLIHSFRLLASHSLASTHSFTFFPLLVGSGWSGHKNSSSMIVFWPIIINPREQPVSAPRLAWSDWTDLYCFFIVLPLLCMPCCMPWHMAFLHSCWLVGWLVVDLVVVVVGGSGWGLVGVWLVLWFQLVVGSVGRVGWLVGFHGSGGTAVNLFCW